MNNKGNSFDIKAATWDVNPDRLELTDKVWALIEKYVDLNEVQSVLDYGCGTGLLGYRFVDSAAEVTFCDTSEGMLAEVAKKRDIFGYQNVKLLKSDFVNEDVIAGRFNMVASMLVLHHIEKLDVLLKQIRKSLKPGGIFCWIDLDEEDGTFHSNNDGIAHFGFSQQKVERLISHSGFEMKHFDSSLKYRKETAKGERFFPIFVAVAQCK
ncbi:MAG: class I SAM-dependent methyltransferase [Prolixibacteraceae bacterium]|jgi:predicted TPR repeat methyltransferase|nr:class I SAM-dependent methyltransferase [Prolixibacteraceae bacterium]